MEQTTQTTEAKPSTKPALTMTPAALAQVKDVITQQGLEGHYLTIRVVPSGCSGLGYDLNILKESRPGDLIWEQDGVMLATDAMSSQYLVGTEMDYVASTTASGFKFNNPNAKSSCGCGSSFNA
jgi:iron-sulfur cluster assembly protein